MATISKYQTKDGASKYRVRFRTPEGRQTDRRGFGTKRDAQEFAATVEVAKLKGEYIAPALSKTMISDLGPVWLKRQASIMKPSAFRSYENAWQTHIAPRWANTRIGAVRRSDVQAWIAELSSRRSASLVGTIHLVFAHILDGAVTDRMLASNPARGVKLPKRPSRPNRYLTAPQLHRLAEAAGRRQPRDRALVLLLGIGGLRWGEAAALRVCDIDFLRRRVELHRNAVRVSGSGMVVGTLKNNKTRTVSLPGFVVDAIAQAATGKERDELLWPAPTGGYQRSPDTNRSWLVKAVALCQEADATFPPVTAHDLRHTAASLAIHGGANPKVVQRMLGHASAAMTLDTYADLFDSDMDRVAESVGKMWASEVQALPGAASPRAQIEPAERSQQ
jgi:integrase